MMNQATKSLSMRYKRSTSKQRVFRVCSHKFRLHLLTSRIGGRRYLVSSLGEAASLLKKADPGCTVVSVDSGQKVVEVAASSAGASAAGAAVASGAAASPGGA